MVFYVRVDATKKKKKRRRGKRICLADPSAYPLQEGGFDAFDEAATDGLCESKRGVGAGEQDEINGGGQAFKSEDAVGAKDQLAFDLSGLKDICKPLAAAGVKAQLERYSKFRKRVLGQKGASSSDDAAFFIVATGEQKYIVPIDTAQDLRELQIQEGGVIGFG